MIKRFIPILMLMLLAVACGPSGAGPTVPSAPPATGASGSTAVVAPTAAPAAATGPAFGSQPTTAPGMPEFKLTSTAFSEGGNIPNKYSCNGDKLSPPLHWSGAPSGTTSFALIMEDPDAPVGTFTHWVAFDIPALSTDIAEGANKAGTSGRNSAGRLGYTPPCPPSGTHRYIFHLYALEVPTLGLKEGSERNQVERAIKPHVIGAAELMGLYGK